MATTMHADAKQPTPMVGLTLAGLRAVGADVRVTDASTTSDICTAVVLQETLPAGWALASEEDEATGFMRHEYTSQDYGQVIRRGGEGAPLVPPPRGVKSYCDLLLENDEGACVGKANRL